MVRCSPAAFEVGYTVSSWRDKTRSLVFQPGEQLVLFVSFNNNTNPHGCSVPIDLAYVDMNSQTLRCKPSSSRSLLRVDPSSKRRTNVSHWPPLSMFGQSISTSRLVRASFRPTHYCLIGCWLSTYWLAFVVYCTTLFRWTDSLSQLLLIIRSNACSIACVIWLVHLQ